MRAHSYITANSGCCRHHNQYRMLVGLHMADKELSFCNFSSKFCYLSEYRNETKLCNIRYDNYTVSTNRSNWAAKEKVLESGTELHTLFPFLYAQWGVTVYSKHCKKERKYCQPCAVQQAFDIVYHPAALWFSAMTSHWSQSLWIYLAVLYTSVLNVELATNLLQCFQALVHSQSTNQCRGSRISNFIKFKTVEESTPELVQVTKPN